MHTDSDDDEVICPNCAHPLIAAEAADPQRAAFEAWWCKAYHPAALRPMEADCYLDLSAGMAWDAWQAARCDEIAGRRP